MRNVHFGIKFAMLHSFLLFGDVSQLKKCKLETVHFRLYLDGNFTPINVL